MKERYTTQSYGRAIKYICERLAIDVWSPGRLRHTVATRLRSEFGLDVAQIILGHSQADVTQVYARADLQKAMAVMERIG